MNVHNKFFDILQFLTTFGYHKVHFFNEKQTKSQI